MKVVHAAEETARKVLNGAKEIGAKARHRGQERTEKAEKTEKAQKSSDQNASGNPVSR